MHHPPRLRDFLLYGIAVVSVGIVMRWFMPHPLGLQHHYLAGIVAAPVLGSIAGLFAWSVVRVWHKLTRAERRSATYQVTKKR